MPDRLVNSLSAEIQSAKTSNFFQIPDVKKKKKITCYTNKQKHAPFNQL